MRLDERVDDIENKLDFDEFNENERKILAYLYGNERITVKIAAELIEMITETTRKFLKKCWKKEQLDGTVIQRMTPNNTIRFANRIF